MSSSHVVTSARCLHSGDVPYTEAEIQVMMMGVREQDEVF